MKRKLERSILFRKYKQQEEANGRTSCSERFFYEAFDRIQGVVFSDREATECGCPTCIATLIYGWEEFGLIIEALLPHIPIAGNSKHKLRCELEKQL
eukprot:4260266-Pyramimonas_sp.AAC.1